MSDTSRVASSLCSARPTGQSAVDPVELPTLHLYLLQQRFTMPARTPVLPSSVVVTSMFLAVVLAVPSTLAQGSRQEPAAANVRAAVPGPSQDLLRQVEEIYKDIHANPELAMQE